MKTVIIPDIHTNHIRAQAIIDSEKADKFVFLGDYFDDFHDNPAMNFNTAIWLADRITSHHNDEFLLGNHDTQYVWELEQCSGFSENKLAAIKSSNVIPLLREKLKLFTVVDGVLLSHAGLTRQLAPYIFTFNWLAHECAEAKQNFLEGKTHWTVMAGADRGNYKNDFGGLTWVDWGTFKPIKDIRQICGHTKGYLPRAKDDNYCIDCNLKYYATIDNGKIEIKTFLPHGVMNKL